MSVVLRGGQRASVTRERVGETPVNLYMHLIDGKPGEFQPSYGTIAYAGKSCRRLATSLKQIRQEQKIAARQDQRDFAAADWPIYSYVRLQVQHSGDGNV